MCKSCFGLQERKDKGRASTSSSTLFFLVGPQSSSSSAAVCNNQCAKVAENEYTPTFDTDFRNVFFWQNKLPLCRHSLTLPCSRGPQMHAEFPDRILYVELFPVCGHSSETDSRVGANRSQRQWFKGQNQQQESLLVKKGLTDTSWWETVFAESSEASLSCLHLTVFSQLLRLSACLFSAGCTSLLLSLISFMSECVLTPLQSGHLSGGVDWICFCQDKWRHQAGILMWEMQSFSPALKNVYCIYLVEMESLSGQVSEMSDKAIRRKGQGGTAGGRAHSVVD